MNFSKGRESKAFESQLKIGVMPFMLEKVCPNHEEIKALYGEEAKAPEYKKKPEAATLLFIFREFDPDTNQPMDNLIRHYHYIEANPNKNKDGDKVEVINKYGESAWVTVDEFKAKQPPAYNKDYILPYRAAFKGETDLVNFIKVYLNIPRTTEWKNGGWVTRQNLEDCEASFSVEEFKTLVSGNFESLKSVLGFQPENKVKFLVGVRTSETGQFPIILFNSPASYGARNFKPLLKQAEYESKGDTYYDTQNVLPHIFTNKTVTSPGQAETFDDIINEGGGSPLMDEESVDDLPF